MVIDVDDDDDHLQYRAKRAVQEIRKFAKQHMCTDDVRVDTKLNQFVWSKGIRNVPFRMRVRLARKRNEVRRRLPE